MTAATVRNAVRVEIGQLRVARCRLLSTPNRDRASWLRREASGETATHG